jgi:hypothetical protein
MTSWDGPAVNAREQLEAWDAGKSVWSIEMGGIGPGYEQAIQILAIEIVRDQINKPLPKNEEYGVWGDSTITRMDTDSEWGYSGAQVGAAKDLAYWWLKFGPKATLAKGARIQISKYWPKAPEVKE